MSRALPFVLAALVLGACSDSPITTDPDGSSPGPDASSDGATPTPDGATPPPPPSCGDTDAGASDAGSSGTTYYVAPGGDDSRSCATAQSSSTPKKTLASAVKCLHPGETLLVRDGTYAEMLSDAIPGGTSWTAPVTIAAYPGEHPVLAPSGTPFVLGFSAANSKYIVIDGLSLDATKVSDDGVKITAGSAGAASHIRLRNSEIAHAPMMGVLVTDGAESNEFIGLDVHDNGLTGTLLAPGQRHGFYIAASNNLVERCHIHGNSGYGVHVYNEHAGQSDDDNVVRFNLIHDNDAGKDRGFGIILSSGTGHQAYGNVIYGNKGGISIAYGATNVLAHDNTIWSNRGADGSGYYCVSIDATSTGADVENNVCWQNGYDITDAGKNTTLAANSTSDPKMADPTHGDFSLLPGSPDIDTGKPINGFAFNGSAPDVGALESPLFSNATLSPDGLTVDVALEEKPYPPITPDTGCTGFTVMDNGAPDAVLSCGRCGADHMALLLAHPIVASDTATLSYAPGNVGDSALVGGTMNAPLLAFDGKPIARSK